MSLSQGDFSDKEGTSGEKKEFSDEKEDDFWPAGSDWMALLLEGIFHSIALAAPWLVTLALMARGAAALLWSSSSYMSRQYAWYQWCLREITMTRLVVVVLIAVVNLVRQVAHPMNEGASPR